jgi:hypothetical protein
MLISFRFRVPESPAEAGLDMMERLAELNKHWTSTGRPKLDIGIGLNTDFVNCWE